MEKTYNETSFGGWTEEPVAQTIRNSFGSYGGGSEVLVLESTQNHATIKDTEVCPTLTANMGMGGGYIPMIISEEDGQSNRKRTTESDTDD